jgi:hypothetical protein
MISKEEVQVLQEVIAKHRQLVVPYVVAETALYMVEKYWLKSVENSMISRPAGSTCGLANPDPPSLTIADRASISALMEAASSFKKCQGQHSPDIRRGDRVALN